MTLTPGTRLGPYEIHSVIGAGGMGVVYRALDSKLNRTVAIKFLTDDLADPAARRRFQREAQTASSLNHPHILTVHDAGEIEGHQYLVTEFVDGGTLRDWIKAAPRDWRDIVELLIGVADGLAAAHDAGILHRDIKPENILITTSGYAKLADFGLAKIYDEAGLETSTRAASELMTQPGVVIGTIAYMSPEQASGDAVDRRSDVFSFGVVLYEMFAGRRPFAGASTLDVVEAIVHRPAAPLPEGVPVECRAVVEKALEKDAARRYQTMRDLVADFRRLARQSVELPTAVARPSTIATLRVPVAAAISLVLALWGALFVLQSRAPAEPSGRATYTQLTNFDSATQPALSADGRILAFIHGPETAVAFTGASSEIYVKLLPDGDPVQLTHDGVPNKFAPQFSPDGGRIAYSTLGDSGWTTWVVPVLGGQEPRRLLSNAEGLTWIQEKTLGGGDRPRVLFSESTGNGITLAVVSSTESRADQRTVYMQPGIMDHFSYLSPDGTQLLLAEMGFNGWQACRVAAFDGGSKGRKIGPEPAQCTGAAWSPDGRWMYFTADVGNGFHIWRQAFPNGAPEQITFGPTEEEGVVVAPDGRSFLTSIGTRQTTLWIHDARGDRQVASDAQSFNPSLSVDGKKLYYLVRTKLGSTIASGDLWVTDLASGERHRLLPEFQMEHYAISQDGRRVVFVSTNDAAGAGVWLATLDNSTSPRRVASSRAMQAFFGADGDLFFAAQEKEGTFVYRVKEDGSGLQKAITDEIYFLYGLTPDGKHIAVWSRGDTEETANAVMMYPIDGGSPTLICGECGYRGGNSLPQAVSWSPDGKLVYLALMGGSAVFAVPLSTGSILPALPNGGLRSIEDVAALPGAKPFPVPGALPGPEASIYAYTKFTAQRNIYRIPIP